MEKNSIIDKFEAQKYEEIIAKREMFTDNLFPPSNESINFQIEEETKQSVPKFLDANVQTKPSSKLNYRWFRISKILKEYHLIKKVKSVSEENLVDDVVQGALGDCYYLSALSALAEYKDRIINIFKSKEINEYGCYQIKCYIHGDEVHLVLDDYFPCVGSDNQPQLAFSSVDLKDYNIWPLLLEKAWAKVNKNYDNIICGTAAHAFQFLTPAGIEVYYHSENFYKLYNHIKEADDRKFIICTDISENSNTASTSIITSLGLLTNHAYSIISAQ